ncbi:hypothetical protein M9980_04575 [Sphingomonas donggukensis]|uniref:Uncharacterized protein n=1 Tax=Sphingomonas donggukensis TaxID=2949093 RepID=A0ABY4TY90_9SPHN|nr:hypothetical protein [Sphingomonas donggukensis]URW76497.1 hypothetical protein M9980_04575 [Sphingomonas donggukensis]
MSTDTPQEKAEAAATRRRWITLAEVVGVAGVLIAALSLYLGWSDRREDAAARQAEQSRDARKATTARLVGTVERGGDRVALADPAQPAVASIDVTFPRALGIAAEQTIVPPRIEAGWIDDAVLKLTDGGADAVRGRMPVLVAATIAEGDRPAVDRAIYDVVFSTEGHTFGGRTLKLEGVVFRERVRGDATARLDALWAVEAKRLARAVRP